MHHLCYLCHVFFMLSRLFIAPLWSPAGKWLTSWLLFVMFNCFSPLSYMVFCVRYGSRLYRFLVFAAFHTFTYIDKCSIYRYKTKDVTAFRSLLKTQKAYPSPLSCDPLDVISELNTLSTLAHSTLSFLWSTPCSIK